MSGGTFRFGPHTCKSSQVFYESPLSHCFVNIKPIVPGHVLVTPKRVCSRFADMTSEEVSDLWLTVHHISPILERHYGCTALNLAIQDGAASGQSVPHVHVHVLPRKQNDFKRSDDVYEELESQHLDRMLDRGHGGGGTATAAIDPGADRRPRTDEQMAQEARQLRQLFASDSPLKSSL
jgi:bis(5'-adenosyl)-triphosphatase